LAKGSTSSMNSPGCTKHKFNRIRQVAQQCAMHHLVNMVLLWLRVAAYGF